MNAILKNLYWMFNGISKNHPLAVVFFVVLVLLRYNLEGRKSRLAKRAYRIITYINWILIIIFLAFGLFEIFRKDLE